MYVGLYWGCSTWVHWHTSHAPYHWAKPAHMVGAHFRVQSLARNLENKKTLFSLPDPTAIGTQKIKYLSELK